MNTKLENVLFYIANIAVLVITVINPEYMVAGIPLIFYAYIKESLSIKFFLYGLLSISALLITYFLRTHSLNIGLTMVLLISIAILILMTESLYKKKVEAKITKSNDIIRAILDQIYIKNNNLQADFEGSSLPNVANNIVAILKNFYHFSYCSILLLEKRGLKCIASNVPQNYICSIEKLSQNLYEESIRTNNKGGQILESGSDSSTLNYESASSRDIKYASFVILGSAGNDVGAILVENKSLYTFTHKEKTYFDEILESITIVIQYLMFQNKIRMSGMIDGLTGILNRKYFEIKLRDELKEHKENSSQFCLAMMDIDHFKSFNDTHGHLFGDKVLATISGFIKDCIRDNDCVCRYGGEELAIIFSNSSSDDIFIRLDKIRSDISNLELITDKGIKTHVTVSFGLAEYPIHGDNRDKLIYAADKKALYKAKEAGRNKVVIATVE